VFETIKGQNNVIFPGQGFRKITLYHLYSDVIAQFVYRRIYYRVLLYVCPLANSLGYVQVTSPYLKHAGIPLVT
jgi:hypothetical protein